MTEPTILIGGGLAAVTAAQTLRDEGFDGHLQLIGREPHAPYLRPPLSKGLLLGTEDEESIGPEMGAVFQRRHERAGVRFRLGETVSAIVEADGRAAGVVLGSGERIAADLVLVAIGVRPDVELARDAGLTVEDGVRVGDGLRTNDPYIWAAGDIAAVYRPDLGRTERLE